MFGGTRKLQHGYAIALACASLPAAAFFLPRQQNLQVRFGLVSSEHLFGCELGPCGLMDLKICA